MKTIAVICPGDPTTTPSTRYRIKQYQPLWEEHGYRTVFFPKKDLSAQSLLQMAEADIILNQKCLLSHGWLKRIQALGLPILFDLDDLIWHRAIRDYSWLKREMLLRRLRSWVEAAKAVTVANSVLARKILEKTRIEPIIIPMSLDLEIWKPHCPSSALPILDLNIGWTGSPEYHHLLAGIAPAIDEILMSNPGTRFTIHSGLDPKFLINYEFIKWQSGNEVDYVKELQIGLLPMENASKFATCKSPIKALQYMALGVVPVGNFVGASLDFLSDKNSLLVEPSIRGWSDGLSRLILDRQLALDLSERAILDVSLNHNLPVVGQQLLTVINSIS
ncbi:hypothetical protein [Cyanobium sp. WAJ14-Wanaka]|uniref:hypothetical protein n=1 Tax=Cyanobium sp. WAJ14-Wanaka TaxID=2823725 RepID=UPI0020CCB26F|nr:hypothetical protein [Cyanobium sp. WAJ14-Wanaka]MCP9776102.1 glycosyltransferase family 4 protein [Cyanobium sp. WAJ14-Wanaka]